jgi:lysozyme family protein
MSTTKFNSFLNQQNKRVTTVTKIEKLAPIVAKWEGGYVDDPLDRGGATNMGVTIATWRLLGYDKNGDGVIDKKDMKLLSKDDFKYVLRRYWNKWQADKIQNQSIANILVDWYWGSGKWGIVIPQRDLLGFKGKDIDGVVGNLTLGRLNKLIQENPKKVFDDIFSLRVKFLHTIVNNSVRAYEKKIGRKATQKERLKNTQERFLKGWLNRLNDFKFAE